MNELIERLEKAIQRVQGNGRAPLPWQVCSGCSYRRISTEPTRENGYFRGPDGNVLSAIVQRSDGHLDLSMSENDLAALCEIVNAVPEMIAALRAHSTGMEGQNDD